MGGSRTPGQRAGLTREAVLAGAYKLLVERGLDGLTMRGLAGRLGVAPNALYSHVASKTALIDDLLDEVLAEVHAPDPDAPDGAPSAYDGLAKIMASTYQVLLDHPDLVPLYLARQGARGANARRLGQVMFAYLARAGVTGRQAHEARRVLIVYTIGFAALAASPPVERSSDRPLPAHELFGNFESGLRWLLAGMLPETRGHSIESTRHID